MKKRTKIGFIILLIIISTLVISCKPKEDPTAFINGYQQNLKDNNFEAAYSKLSSMSKKNVSKEDFITWKTLYAETMQLKEFKITKSSEGKNKKIDGTKYKNSIEYTIVEKSMDLYEDKEVTTNYKQNVVDENGKWKLYRGTASGKEMIASEYNSIGWMYAEGKGKDKDLAEAATMFNNGLEYDKDYFLLYYGLGSVYSDLERYDDSIKAIDTYLLKETDNNLKSAAYNIKGLDYAKEDLMDDAKKMFNKSLELNPNNEYAKTNLNHASNLSNSVSSTSTPEPTTTPEESTTTSSDPSYKSYINDRFAFSIDYPITFIASPSPTNNDGITLSSQDGNTELTVSGINNVLNQTPTSAYNDLLKDHSNAAYKDQESNWFVVSWLEGDKIVYEKSVVGSGSMNTFIIKYPSKQKDYYNSIVSQLNSSFKTPGIELAH